MKRHKAPREEYNLLIVGYCLALATAARYTPSSHKHRRLHAYTSARADTNTLYVCVCVIRMFAWRQISQRRGCEQKRKFRWIHQLGLCSMGSLTNWLAPLSVYT